MSTVYTVIVNDQVQEISDDLETAIRVWDASTYLGGMETGGIQVESFADGVQVRDGWILHVREGGRVYLNPNLAVA